MRDGAVLKKERWSISWTHTEKGENEKKKHEEIIVALFITDQVANETRSQQYR